MDQEQVERCRDTAKSVAWLHTLLKELWLITNESINLCVDNLSAITLVNLIDSVNKCSKHIEIHYHWIHSTVCKGIILIFHIPSEFNFLDILTKSLDFNSHTHLTSSLGLS